MVTCQTFNEQLKLFYALSQAKLIADQDRRPESILLMQEKHKAASVPEHSDNLADVVQ